MSSYLECVAIDKSFPGPVQALSSVDLRVGRGRIHAVIGENGAGKTTLAEVLGGLVGFDSGSIRFRGRDYRPASPRDADRLGIGLVHQHFSLFPSLTVTENVILGHEPAGWGRIDMARAEREVRSLSQRYGLPLDPRRKVDSMSIGERQRVEILKVLYRGAELIILDEPTAVLAPGEVQELLHGIRRLSDQGFTVILISHRLDEVLSIADDITVLRHGRVVGHHPGAGASHDELVVMMVGDEGTLDHDRGFGRPTSDLLVARGLTLRGHTGRPLLDDVSFSVRSGEILGFAGVEGNGQLELEQSLGGLIRLDGGVLGLGGADITHASPRTRRSLGLAYVPSDRLAWGSAADASVHDNAISLAYRHFQTVGVSRPSASTRWVERMLQRFDLRVPNLAAPLRSLSGGRIQRLVIGRELGTLVGDGGPDRPRAIVVANPTRGLDIRAIGFVHDLLVSHRDAGCAILLLSTDLQEIVALSDRIAVLFEGRVVAVLPGRGATGKQELGRFMARGAIQAAPDGREARLP